MKKLRLTSVKQLQTRKCFATFFIKRKSEDNNHSTVFWTPLYLYFSLFVLTKYLSYLSEYSSYINQLLSYQYGPISSHQSIYHLSFYLTIFDLSIIYPSIYLPMYRSFFYPSIYLSIIYLSSFFQSLYIYLAIFHLSITYPSNYPSIAIEASAPAFKECN